MLTYSLLESWNHRIRVPYPLQYWISSNNYYIPTRAPSDYISSTHKIHGKMGEYKDTKMADLSISIWPSDSSFFLFFSKRFSAQKIYHGRGTRFIRSYSQVFLFASSKCKRYFHSKLKPSKLIWTAMYRKQHKKLIEQDIDQEALKKRCRATKKSYSRAIVGAT